MIENAVQQAIADGHGKFAADKIIEVVKALRAQSQKISNIEGFVPHKDYGAVVIDCILSCSFSDEPSQAEIDRSYNYYCDELAKVDLGQAGVFFEVWLA